MEREMGKNGQTHRSSVGEIPGLITLHREVEESDRRTGQGGTGQTEKVKETEDQLGGTAAQRRRGAAATTRALL